MKEELKKFFSENAGLYARYISLFLYPQGFRAFFAGIDGLRPNLRVLEAGCGTGIGMLALLKVLTKRKYDVECSHAFDLTPAMLELFQNELNRRKIMNVELHRANVMNLEELPESWKNYDLIISASMLEYIPREKFVETLAGLRSHLSDRGRFILFMTRRNRLMWFLVERIWGGNRYSRKELADAFAAAGFCEIKFHKFPLHYGWLNLWGHIIEGRK